MNEYEEAIAQVEESLNFIKTVKLMDGESYALERFVSKLTQTKKIRLKSNIFLFLLWAFIFAYITFKYGILALIGKHMIINGWMNDNWKRVYTSGDVITIIYISTEGITFLSQIVFIFREIGVGIAAFQSINSVLKIKTNDINGVLKPSSVSGDIEFKNVTFSFPQNKERIILRDVSFKISSGKKIAIIGKNGSGTSTIFYLLFRFYEPDLGEILLDGINIKEYDVNHLRRCLGLIFDKPMLFSESIRANLSLGVFNQNLTDNEIWDALDLVNAKQLVLNLPNGLDEQIVSANSVFSPIQKNSFQSRE